MASKDIMTVRSLLKKLKEFKPEISDDFEIWLSSDEEGNEFLPMSKNSELSIGIDTNGKRIVFFPRHR